MKKVRINRWLQQKLDSKVYEFYYNFNIFADYLLDTLDEVDGDHNTMYPMKDCLFHLLHSIPKLRSLQIKRAKQKHCTRSWEYTKQVYNLIPRALWESYYDNIDAYLSDLDYPDESMASDAHNDFLQSMTLEGIDKELCVNCKNKIKCAMRGGK